MWPFRRKKKSVLEFTDEESFALQDGLRTCIPKCVEIYVNTGEQLPMHTISDVAMVNAVGAHPEICLRYSSEVRTAIRDNVRDRVREFEESYPGTVIFHNNDTVSFQNFRVQWNHAQSPVDPRRIIEQAIGLGIELCAMSHINSNTIVPTRNIATVVLSFASGMGCRLEYDETAERMELLRETEGAVNDVLVQYLKHGNENFRVQLIEGIDGALFWEHDLPSSGG